MIKRTHLKMIHYLEVKHDQSYKIQFRKFISSLAEQVIELIGSEKKALFCSGKPSKSCLLRLTGLFCLMFIVIGHLYVMYVRLLENKFLY